MHLRSRCGRSKINCKLHRADCIQISSDIYLNDVLIIVLEHLRSNLAFLRIPRQIAVRHIYLDFSKQTAGAIQLLNAFTPLTQ